jgi:26S proteasome non-ATPase regulatory subunit 10
VKDEDDRLPIHWAVAYNHMPVVELLVSMKNFDPDVEVRISFSRICLHPSHCKLDTDLRFDRMAPAGPR